MSISLQEYSNLSSSSPRAELSNVLQRIIQAPQSSVDSDTRRSLVSLLLEDINLCAQNQKSNKSRIASKDASQALLALKVLGYHRSGSEIIATPTNLSSLLSASTAFKDLSEASAEALRCVANALLLVDGARSDWISKDVGGGVATVEYLEKSTSPEQLFVASRLLFLSTASLGVAVDFIKALVEGKVAHHNQNIVDIIGMKLDVLLNGILAGTKFSREAMAELLKFAFNIAIHYPKIADGSDDDSDQKGMGERWNDRLDGLLCPLLRVFNSLPPTFPSPLTSPMTHVIHALLTIPVSQSLYLRWFPRTNGAGTGSPSAYNSRTPRSSTSNSPNNTTHPQFSWPSPSDASANTKPGRVDRALSKLAAGRLSLSSRSTSPYRAAPSDTLLHAYSLLDVTLSYYLPGDIDPDDASVREQCKQEGEQSLDDVLTPLVVLMTRLCIGDETSRTRLREWLIPHDLDRTTALEGRSDFLGRCLRLLGSVYHSRLKDAVGEMLYGICDSDAGVLSAQVGYGNVAGFLFNKGVFNPPGQTSTTSGADIPTSSSGVPINPITGVAQKPTSLPEMTDEEKEQEAEKLFVLFDRLEKSGSIQPSQNPIRQAVEKGRLG